MEINGVTLEFDFTDADTVDCFEESLLKVYQTLDEDMSDMKRSDAIRKCCHAVFDFFNAVFGEGTDRELFGSRCSLKDCTDALEAVVKESFRQTKAYTDRKIAYSPSRVQRRGQ